MNEHNLTITESQMLIMIYEGKDISEIAQWRNVPMQVFDSMIRNIMDKTASKTWEELKIVGAQLARIANGGRVDLFFTEEEKTSIEYLANKWKRVPETDK